LPQADDGALALAEELSEQAEFFELLSQQAVMGVCVTVDAAVCTRPFALSHAFENPIGTHSQLRCVRVAPPPILTTVGVNRRRRQHVAAVGLHIETRRKDARTQPAIRQPKVVVSPSASRVCGERFRKISVYSLKLMQLFVAAVSRVDVKRDNVRG
jgi:hypothetical protein